MEKDPNDKNKKKLQPLGVPLAMRQIAAVLVVKESAPFAEHLLPFNLAIGIGGGIDMIIIKTLQISVDKYSTNKENNDELPTRSLVSH